MPVIGFLNSTSPSPFAPFVAAFHHGLRETGYVAGQNVAIEYRWAEGDYDRLPALAADLVDRKVDLIATPGGNLTGISMMFAELMPKLFELLFELVPGAGVIALCVNPKNPLTERIIIAVREAARAKGVQLTILK